MVRKRRSKNQMREETSFRIVRQKLPEAWVIHEYGPDYGIDYVVELFDYVDDEKQIAETLGETFYVQLKASDSVEYAVRRAYSRGNVAKGALNEDRSQFVDISVAKFQLEMSELLTIQAMGPAIPVLLILVDLKTERAFFVCLNDYIDKIIIPEDPHYASKDSKVISIPTLNEIGSSDAGLVALRTYGKRSKMFGAFAKFSYQKKEIERARGNAKYNLELSMNAEMDMLRQFVETALRQDVWTAHEFWEPVGLSFNELRDAEAALAEGIQVDDWEAFKAYCDEVVWHHLNNLGNMYEELVREWFLPTLLAQLMSYPEVAQVQTTEAPDSNLEQL